MLAFALACLVYLVAAPSPWSSEVDTSREVKESIRTQSWVLVGFWYAAAANLILVIFALLAWHFRPRMTEGSGLEISEPSDSEEEKDGFASGKWSRRFLVVFAMGVVAWAMYPRLDLSLWGDEEATTRRFIIGHLYRAEEGGFTVKPPTWQKTVWNWDTGTNSHTLFNILSRLSHGPADTSPDDPGRFYFSEWKIRLPSFLATLLLIPASAWLVGLLGYPRGGPPTALLLALHPWIIRFGSDARGYALMMTLGLLAAACLVQALRRPDRLLWWLAFGCSQFLLLMSHLTSLYLLIPLNIAGLWLAWAPFRPGRWNPLKCAAVWRWAGASLAGAMLTIQVMMPIALQMPGYLEAGRLNGEINSRLIIDFLAYWALGTPWHPWDPGNPLALCWQDLRETRPLTTVLSAALIGLFAIAGVGRLFFRPGWRWLLLPLLAPVALMFLDANRSGHLLYPWYTIGFLPLFFVVVGVGLGAALPSAGRWPRWMGWIVPALAGLLIIAVFAHATDPKRRIVRNQAVEPLADSVRVTRQVVNPFHPRIDETLTLGFVHATRLYDPAMTLAESDEQFVSALREAEDTQRPLWVNAANLGIAAERFPLSLQLVDDRDVFEEPVVLPGLQDPCTRYLFRYRPGGLARFEARKSASR